MTDLAGSASWLEGYALCLRLAALGVVLHECGHVVGCLLTARPVLWSGPLLLSFKIASVPTTIRCPPLNGQTAIPVRAANRQPRTSSRETARAAA